MKTILVFAMIVVTGMDANSQCDKKVTWYGTKGEMYDANGVLLDTRLDSISLVTDPQYITLRLKSDSKGLEGSVTEKICDWKEPFRNGKSIYHATVLINNESSKATLTIEARDGKITVSVEIEALGDKKYLVYIDEYTEAR